MVGVDALQQLRMAAISERLGNTVGSNQLIQAALDALQPLVGWVSEWEDWARYTEQCHCTYRQHIIDSADQLLEQPWPLSGQ